MLRNKRNLAAAKENTGYYKPHLRRHTLVETKQYVLHRIKSQSHKFSLKLYIAFGYNWYERAFLIPPFSLNVIINQK